MSSGKIQNRDFKTLAEILLAGGTKDELTHESNIFVSAFGNLGGRALTLMEALEQRLIALDQTVLQLRQHPTNPGRVVITGTKTMGDNTQITQLLNNLLVRFNGAEIDINTGNIYQGDGVSALGINYVPTVVPNGSVQWFSVTLVAAGTNSDGSTAGQIEVVQASSSTPITTNKAAAADIAVKPSFASPGFGLGMFYIVGGPSGNTQVTQDQILQIPLASAGNSTPPNQLVSLQPKFRAVCFMDGTTEEYNCDPPSLTLDNRSKILIHANITSGDYVEVIVDGKEYPLFINALATPGPWYKIDTPNLISFHTNLNALHLPFELRTFNAAPPVPTLSLIAGLSLKNRAVVMSDNSGTSSNAAASDVGPNTYVTTNFDLNPADAYWITVDGVYYPKFVDSSVTPGKSWQFAGPRSIMFNSVLSGSPKLIDIEDYQGQSIIDAYGNMYVDLKGATDPVYIKSPDNTIFFLTATNLGEMAPQDVPSGVVIPYRIPRDGDAIPVAIEINDLGETSVDDAPVPGIVVPTLHIASPNGVIWRIGVEADNTLYLEDGDGNKAVWRNDQGDVLKQINESVAGMIENNRIYLSPDDLPNPPTVVAGTVPEASAYVPAPLDRVCRFIYTQGQWRRLALAEEIAPGGVAPAPVPLGSILDSILTPLQMQSVYGNQFVLADGRDITGSLLNLVYHFTTVPDARGLFVRAKNNGRSDGWQNPDGDFGIGALQRDTFQDHSHYTPSGYVLVGAGFAPYAHHCSAFQNYIVDTTAQSGRPGGETRPINITLNRYIRIN